MHKIEVCRLKGKLHPIGMQNWHARKDHIEHVIQWIDFQNMNSIISYWVV